MQKGLGLRVYKGRGLGALEGVVEVMGSYVFCGS